MLFIFLLLVAIASLIGGNAIGHGPPITYLIRLNRHSTPSAATKSAPVAKASVSYDLSEHSRTIFPIGIRTTEAPQRHIIQVANTLKLSSIDPAPTSISVLEYDERFSSAINMSTGAPQQTKSQAGNTLKLSSATSSPTAISVSEPYETISSLITITSGALQHTIDLDAYATKPPPAAPTLQAKYFSEQYLSTSSTSGTAPGASQATPTPTTYGNGSLADPYVEVGGGANPNSIAFAVFFGVVIAICVIIFLIFYRGLVWFPHWRGWYRTARRYGGEVHEMGNMSGTQAAG
ncbi:hypothetical protein MMC10_003498 [Thelotrema lepadinum]|nr:hypothetical protein [Thelotrema lepadinum]